MRMAATDLVDIGITWDLGKYRFWFRGSQEGAGDCISNKLPGEANAAGPRTTLAVETGSRKLLSLLMAMSCSSFWGSWLFSLLYSFFPILLCFSPSILFLGKLIILTSHPYQLPVLLYPSFQDKETCPFPSDIVSLRPLFSSAQKGKSHHLLTVMAKHHPECITYII